MKIQIQKMLLCFSVLGLASPASHAALAVSGRATAAPTEGGYTSAIIDTSNGFVAFGSSVPFVSGISTFSAISIFNISPAFNYGGSDAFFDHFTALSAAVLDPGTGFSYWASTSTPSALEQIHLVIPVTASSTTFPPSINAVGTAVIDTTNHVAYFGTRTSPSMVAKFLIPDGVSVTSMTFVSSITLPAGLESLSASVIDIPNGFAYFGSSTTPGAVAKIQLSNFTLAGTLPFNSGEGGVGSAVIDQGKQLAYFGTHDTPGKIVAVNLTNFTRSQALTLQSGHNDLTSAVLDTSRNLAYFGTNTAPGIVVRVSLATLTEGTAVSLQTGEDFLTSAEIDTSNSYAYFGTYTTPGHVIQMDLLAGPPEILLQPQDVSVHPGDSVTFSVKADGRNLTYQWQLNGASIVGATSTAYTHSALLTEDGSAYSCIVTNANGSTTTANAHINILPVIKVYPNPWRADRHAGVSITFEGLLPNSTVKIFNLAAHWIKTLPLASGSTTWDRTNDQGQAVASGYYFYLITNGNDKQTVHDKLLIIR